MRGLIQRVSSASVDVRGQTISQIRNGYVVLLGIRKEDTQKDQKDMISRILNLRLFEDSRGKMAYTIGEKKGELLIVSQITLYASFNKGRRPDFSQSMPPSSAKAFYCDFLERLKQSTDCIVKDGKFGEMMDVHIANRGPVTIWIETE